MDVGFLRCYAVWTNVLEKRTVPIFRAEVPTSVVFTQPGELQISNNVVHTLTQRHSAPLRDIADGCKAPLIHGTVDIEVKSHNNSRRKAFCFVSILDTKHEYFARNSEIVLR